MGAILVYCSLVHLHYVDDLVFRRLVQMQQQKFSNYAMNSVNDTRLSSML